MLSYSEDYDEAMPTMWYLWTHVPQNQAATSNYCTWAEQLQPYIRNDQIFQCPDKQYSQAQMGLANCYPTAYNYNFAISDLSLGGMNTPSQLICVYDGTGTSDDWWPPQSCADLLSVIPGTEGWSSAQLQTVQRHNGGANCGYADGHAKWQNHAMASDFTP
jgi:prepilin-type processing-associated H-X9-DG protein